MTSTLSSSLQFTFNFGNEGQSTSVSSHSTAHSFSYGTTSGSLGSIYLGSLFFVSGYNRRSVGAGLCRAPLPTLCKEHDCTSLVSCRPAALKRECRPIRGIPVHTAVGDTPTGMFVLALGSYLQFTSSQGSSRQASISDQFVNVRKYLHTLGKVLINFPSACQHFWTLFTMLFDFLQHDCGHLL